MIQEKDFKAFILQPDRKEDFKEYGSFSPSYQAHQSKELAYPTPEITNTDEFNPKYSEALVNCKATLADLIHIMRQVFQRIQPF